MSKNRVNIFFALVTSISLGVFSANAQDLSAIGEGPDFKVSGGVNLNQVFYATSGNTRRRDPYNYFLGGNIAVSAYGLSVPLSFSYSNQNFSFAQPFNQYGLQPTYKWVRGYIGYNSLNFSKYTLAGHIFNGVGLALEPEGPFSATIMYGRLQKAVIPDSTAAGAQPTYRRMGWGVKLAYAKGGDKAELSLFGAMDDATSLSLIANDSLLQGMQPMQNLALGLNLSKAIGEKLTLNVEYGNSSLTRDHRAALVDRAATSTILQPVAFLNPLNPQKTSTAYYQAVKGGLNWNLTVVNLGLGYERIDPGYQTLGAYFFNNDLENFTANVSTTFWDQKISLASNVGAQRNNLDGDQASRTARLVGSVNLGGQINPKLNLNLNYSNFQTFARMQSRDQFQYLNSLSEFDQVNVDTLTFVQVNQTAAATGSFVLSASKERPMALVANLSYSASADTNPESGAGSSFYNSSLAYSFKDQASGFGLSAAVNATFTLMDSVRSQQFGPTLSANQALLENALKINASISANRSLSNVSAGTGWINNLRLSGNYQLLEKHQFRLNLTVLNRPDASEARRLTELTGNLGYSFSF